MIDAGLSEAEARSRFHAVDRDGLLVEGMAGLVDFQAPFVRQAGDVAGWACEQPGRIGLLDVVKNAKPTVLIGVSAQGAMFSEAIVRAMAATVERPIISPSPTRHPARKPRRKT
ncbi:MAG: malic enzyme-like NAD(P)-binding protein [Methyloceanibacter sp.]